MGRDRTYMVPTSSVIPISHACSSHSLCQELIWGIKLCIPCSNCNAFDI